VPPANAITLSSNELVLYSGTSASQINFWTSDEKSLESISYKGTLRGHKRLVLCLTSVGKLLCSGSAEKTIRRWTMELVSGSQTHHTCLAVSEGYNSSVKCMTAVVPAWTTYSSLLSQNSYSFHSSLSSCSYQDNNHCSTSVDDDFGDNEGRSSDSQMFVLYSGSLDGSLKLWCINSNGIGSESCHSCSLSSTCSAEG
jgi:WD40 repeat protein